MENSTKQISIKDLTKGMTVKFHGAEMLITSDVRQKDVYGVTCYYANCELVEGSTNGVHPDVIADLKTYDYFQGNEKRELTVVVGVKKEVHELALKVYFGARRTPALKEACVKAHFWLAVNGLNEAEFQPEGEENGGSWSMYIDVFGSVINGEV
jgi:hypothetical protein